MKIFNFISLTASSSFRIFLFIGFVGMLLAALFSGNALAQAGVGNTTCGQNSSMPSIGTGAGAANASTANGTVTFIQNFNGGATGTTANGTNPPKFASIDYWMYNNYPCLPVNFDATIRPQVATGDWISNGSQARNYPVPAAVTDPTVVGGKFLWAWTKINDLLFTNYYSTAANRVGLFYGTAGHINVPFTAGKQYRFSIKTISGNGNPPRFQVVINGVVVGNITPPSSPSSDTLTNANWVTNTLIYNATITTATGTLAINQLEANGDGNDFAVDDISLTLIGDAPKTLQLAKTWSNATVNDAVNITATGLTSLASVANTASETDVGALQNVTAGSIINLVETFTTGTAANYTSTLVCTGTSGLSGSTLTVGAADTAIVCTFTNTLNTAAITITKTDGKSIATSGSLNSYTITVSNAGPANAAGSVLTDTPSADLTCPGTLGAATVSCTATNGAQCPGATAINTPLTVTYAALTVGAVIPQLPASGSLSFTYQCTVN